MGGRLSSPRRRIFVVEVVVGLGWGGGGPGGCATRGQTDMRGLGTAGPCFVVRARCLETSVAAGAAAHRSTADALARGGQAGSAASSAECRGVGVRSRLGVCVCVDDRPDEPGEVSGDGDRDDRLALAAL